MTRSQTANSPKWRSRSSDEIVWAQFDEEFVAYLRPSGQTHFLNSASYLLICDLLREPREFIEIAAEYASDDIDCHSNDYREALMALLARLEMLGLVERV